MGVHLTHSLPRSGMHVLSHPMAQVVRGTHGWQVTEPLAVVNVPGVHVSQVVLLPLA
jgi:hypothetical protein